MTDTDTGALVDAARAMAHELADVQLACEVGPKLNCGEAELIAAVMVHAGCRNEAAEWLAGHGIHDDNTEEPADDIDDRHGHLHHVDARGVEIRNIDLARGYVDRRWPRT